MTGLRRFVAAATLGPADQHDHDDRLALLTQVPTSKAATSYSIRANPLIRVVFFNTARRAASRPDLHIPSPRVPLKPLNSPRQVLFASLIGTAIEFFDFYIYATAAVLVFPRLFFPRIRSRGGNARLARHLCDRLCRAPDRLRPVRPFRRPRRPQDHTRRGAVDDGRVDGADWHSCRRTARSGSPRRSCSPSAASVRASDLAANGAAPCSSRSRTRRPASAPGTACFRSSVRRSAFCFPAVCFCCSPGRSPTSSSSPMDGAFHFCRVRCW